MAFTAIGISFLEDGWVPVTSTISPAWAFLSALRVSTSGTGQVSPEQSTLISANAITSLKDVIWTRTRDLIS